MYTVQSSCAVSQFGGCSLGRTRPTQSAKAASFVDWDRRNRAALAYGRCPAASLDVWSLLEKNPGFLGDAGPSRLPIEEMKAA